MAQHSAKRIPLPGSGAGALTVPRGSLSIGSPSTQQPVSDEKTPEPPRPASPRTTGPTWGLTTIQALEPRPADATGAGAEAEPTGDFVEYRRADRRFARRVPVEFVHEGVLYRAHTRNLSLGGIFLDTDVVLPLSLIHISEPTRPY